MLQAADDMPITLASRQRSGSETEGLKSKYTAGEELGIETGKSIT